MATRNLGLKIDHKSGIPLYIQIKHQIRNLISAKIWDAGFKLPTERKLAQFLGVSRNTVSAAYKELQTEGLLLSLQGRGTFVAGKETEKDIGRKERLLNVIDLALEEAAELGFSPDDFLILASNRALEQKELLETTSIAFIGTSREQALYFRHELVPQAGIKITPFLLDEIENDLPAAKNSLQSFDLIVTTFLEIDQLQKLIQLPAVPVLGIALELELETIVRVARLPKNSSVALVCSSEAFALTVKESFQQTGITNLNIIPVTGTGASLAIVLDQVDVVAVSIDRVDEILNLERKIKVIKLKYRIDQGSLNMLRCYLADLRSQDQSKNGSDIL